MPDPLTSVAVTVMIVRPAVPGVIVNMDPDLLNVATDVSDELAPNVSVSLSGSWKAAATSTSTAMTPLSAANLQ